MGLGGRIYEDAMGVYFSSSTLDTIIRTTSVRLDAPRSDVGIGMSEHPSLQSASRRAVRISTTEAGI